MTIQRPKTRPPATRPGAVKGSLKGIRHPDHGASLTRVKASLLHPAAQHTRHAQTRRRLPVNRKTLARIHPVETRRLHPMRTHHPRFRMIGNFIPIHQITPPPKAIDLTVAPVLRLENFRTALGDDPELRQLAGLQTPKGHRPTEPLFLLPDRPRWPNPHRPRRLSAHPPLRHGQGCLVSRPLHGFRPRTRPTRIGRTRNQAAQNH